MSGSRPPYLHREDDLRLLIGMSLTEDLLESQQLDDCWKTRSSRVCACMGMAADLSASLLAPRKWIQPCVDKLQLTVRVAELFAGLTYLPSEIALITRSEANCSRASSKRAAGFRGSK